jgi:hypothetical protein
MPPVPPIPTVTSPVGVLRQQARREVQQEERFSARPNRRTRSPGEARCASRSGRKFCR